ncbi:GNAT family N-acetyltransferase [Photobacterium alginatilyticum]|uniref:N-acetyltransferase n=1 Tax=Photobacterium alginatilyticum TaxID=1775171 RepID=A0ABW9YHG7_9GAMM|nr:GNAT family N-acetyltransferase [Photobacterium alginatilyticum]NBI53158.1 N-acetyltransferase [Photobacterium alginatilyticum]
MQQDRYQVYHLEESSFQLSQSFSCWQQVVQWALELELNKKQKWYVVDIHADDNCEDVFQIDAFGLLKPTGHCAGSLYEQVRLLSLPALTLEGVIEPLGLTDGVTVLKTLAEASYEIQVLNGNDGMSTFAAESSLLEAPFQRQYQSDNDVALLVYCHDELIASALFSRYIEDHRFPFHSSELCYELSLHTVYVLPEYRSLGIATSLANSIVNIARKDMLNLHHVLQGKIRLKPWFSALALTPGGEAICDILSEAFVEMNDDIIEELMDEGMAISYQDPVIFVEGMA